MQIRTKREFGALDPVNFTPYPQNPVISAFFREIHRADEPGSGWRKMMRYGKAYGGTDPHMIEDDIFRIIVKVPEFGTTTSKVTSKGGTKSGPSWAHEAHDGAHEPMSHIEQTILENCYESPQTTPGLLNSLGYKSRTGNFKRAVSHLLEMGFLEMTVPAKPRSKKQKYRLTEKGRKFLDKAKGDSE